MKLTPIFEEIIFEENTEQISPAVIFNYINKLHSNGWEKSKYEDKEWVYQHDYFILKEVLLSDKNIKWPINTAPIYVKENGPFPPIVVGSNGYIMDGMHRAASAKSRGDKSIMVYVGHIKEQSQLNEINNLNSTKIVDSDGRPMIVYRAQKDDRIQGVDRQSKHKGIYFSADKDSTKIYGDNIKAYYLNIKNPLVLKDTEWNLSVIPEHVFNHLISKGYDGAVWLRKGIMYEIVAFNPEQVSPA